MKIFDGFVPIVPEMYNEDENYGVFIDVKPSDLERPVNVSIFRPRNENGYKAGKEWQFHRFRKITAKELRKRVGVFSINPYCFECAFESTNKIVDGFLLYQKEKFTPIKIPNYEYDPRSVNDMIISAQVAMGVQFNLENQCYVYIKPEDSEIGFNYLIMDIGQLKDLFKLRDIPDGYKRRLALKHWVAKHMRRKPSNHDEITYVKKYLRGRKDFSWFGFSGEIFVNT